MLSSGPTPGGRSSRDGSAGEGLRVLVVDQDARDRERIREVLRASFPGAETIDVADPADLPRILAVEHCDLVVTDHRAARIDAFAVLARVREHLPDLPLILCTAAGSEDLAVFAVKAGFSDYVPKTPESLPRLASAARSALDEAARRRTERDADALYRSLFEGVPVGLLRATPSGQILDANPALVRMLGYPSRESLMAVNLRQLYREPGDRETLRRRLEAEGEVRDLEVCWRRYAGQLIWLRQDIRAMRDSQGRLLHYEGVLEDITERKQFREELLESNQFREEIISGAGEGIIVYDGDLRHLVWNRFMESRLALPADRVLGRRALDLFPRLADHGVERLLHRALAGETVTSSDIPSDALAAGRSGWMVATFGPHRGADGQIVGVIAIVHDVTDRRLAEQALRESEERFRRMADASPVLIWMDDASGLCTYFNKSWLDFTGRTLEQEIGHGWWETVHPADLQRFRAVYDQAQAAHRSFQTEYRVRRADGEYRWVIDTGAPRFTPQGAFDGYIGSSIDITDRRRAEDALKESEARYRTQIEHAPEAIVVFDVDAGRFIEANDNALKLWGLNRKALLLTNPADLSPHLQPDGRGSAEAIRSNIARTLAGEAPIFEWVHRDAAGRDIPCEVRLVRLPSASRRLVRGSVTDISERKRSEKLQSALYRIAATTSSAEDIDEFYAAIHGIVGELMYARNFYVALYEPTTDTIAFPYFVDEVDARPEPMRLGRTLTAHVLRTGEPLLTLEDDFEEMVRGGQVELVGASSVAWLGVPLKRTGVTFGALVVQSYDPRFCFNEADREVLTFVSQHIAVALERKRAQDAIRDSEERYRLLFERNLAGVYRMTLGGRILDCNDAMARIFGYASRSEVLDRDIRTLYPVEGGHEEFLEALLQFRTLTNYELCGRHRDGHPVWTLENASLLADETAGEIIVEGTITDITDRRTLEEQLRQSQKLEAIGQLAGGVAHDFNNLLTSVLGYSDIALRLLQPNDPVRSEIQEIRKAGERAANLTRQLLAFSRKQVFEPRTLGLNALIAESGRMLGRLIGEHIRLVTDLDASLGSVRADPGQIEQVIVNLVVNARDAMPDGGTLTVRTRNADVEPGSSREHFGIDPGAYVVIAVEDTGIGIDSEIQKHIFEPFFTTKDKPHGTGLGLATVYGIVSQSGGRIFVSSQPGRGATFSVYLPRVERPACEPAAPPELQARPGSETILLVEDEDAVRNLTRRCLQASGYEVLEAANAEEALDVASRHSGRLHLLVTDVIMPGASGPDLSRQLRARRPDLRVLFVSGYTDAAVASHGVLENGAAFLQKPFTPDALARKVREVLDAGTASELEGERAPGPDDSRAKPGSGLGPT
jgi:two-component system cell cycle sensor histidine kinase/response regulator CckA